MLVGIKPGVKILGLTPEITIGLVVAANTFSQFNENFTLTSGVEGPHQRASAHKAGNAFDCRLPASRDNIQKVVTVLRGQLGENFDVVLEADHIHVEYQPK